MINYSFSYNFNTNGVIAVGKREINMTKVFGCTWGLLLLLSMTLACEDARRVSLSESLSPNMMNAGTDFNAGHEGGDEVENVGGIGGGDQGGTSIGPIEELVPGAPVWSRLTQSQYRNMLNDILGLESSDLDLEPDTNPYLFTSIGAEVVRSPLLA